MDSVRGLVGALIAIRDAELFADGIDAGLPRKATRAEVFALGRESVFDELVSHGIDIAALAQQPAGEAVAWGVLLNGRLQYAVRSREACESEASVYGSGVTVEIVPLYLHTPADSAPLVEWTDKQCYAFAAVAFRHAPKNLPEGVTLQDIRMGAQRALAAGGHNG